MSIDAVGCEKYGRTVKVMKRVPNFTPQRAININLNPKPKRNTQYKHKPQSFKQVVYVKTWKNT